MIDLLAISRRARLVPHLSLTLVLFAVVCWGGLAVGEPSRPIVTACPAPEPGVIFQGGGVFTTEGKHVQGPGWWERRRPGGIIYAEDPIDPPAMFYYLRGARLRYELRCSYGRYTFDPGTELIFPITGVPMRCEQLFYEVDTLRPEDLSPFRDTRWLSYACESEPFLPFYEFPTIMRS